MSRGDKELGCLQRVRRHVFSGAGEFNTGEPDSSVLHKSFFGFSHDDWQRVCEVLASATPTPDLNAFPDFVSGTSALEHFEITATKESGRGALFKRGREPFVKKVNREQEQAKREGSSQPLSHTFSYPERSHEAILASIKRNMDNHIQSLQSYRESHAPEVVVFIIEHQERGLEMMENRLAEIGGERVFGDLLKRCHFKDYRLSRDREALGILREYANEVDFVVFAGVSDIEVIKLAEIGSILKLLPYPFAIRAGVTVERHTLTPLFVSHNQEESGHEQD